LSELVFDFTTQNSYFVLDGSADLPIEMETFPRDVILDLED